MPTKKLHYESKCDIRQTSDGNALEVKRLVGTVRYSRTARALHWVTLLLVISQFTSHFLIDSYGENNPASGPFKFMHGIGGLLILITTLFRIFWRWRNPPPALTGIASWQILASAWVHRLLYCLLIAQPVSGMIAANKPAAGVVHGTLSIILLTILTIHISAALWHHFVAKDKVLRRMI
jgi:cytochrome b561